MNLVKNRWLCLIIMLTNCLFSYALEPENIDNAKKQAIQYHDSGQYDHDFSVVTEHALYYLKFRINQNARLKQPKKLAAVFDIDETALSNYAHLVYLNFGGTKLEMDALKNKATDPAIPYTLTLYTYAKAHGIALFFITGRYETLRKATENNLKAAGYPEWTALYMKPNYYHEASVIPYKIAMRKKIEAAGYDIVLNIGDEQSDLSGGHADATFKAPNPFYLVR